MFSSLDADNFVSAQETRQILSLYAELGDRFVFHHFSGTWGDGTCGRVTLSSQAYRAVGYDETFLPRQFDEVDMIVSTLIPDPDLLFIAYPAADIFEKSTRLRKFLQDSEISMSKRIVPDYRVDMPLDAKETGYTQRHPWLARMAAFNEHLSFAKHSRSPEQKEAHLGAATAAADALIDAMSPDEVLPNFFGIAAGSVLPTLDGSRVPLFACVRDDAHLLRHWYRHYKALGCGPFVIVDNGSARPVQETLPFADVHVLTPAAGHYRACKAIWLKAAMRALLADGQWVVTVDSDEFVDIPSKMGRSFSGLTRRAEASGAVRIPGLLMDMLPRKPEAVVDALGRGQAVVDLFDHHLLDASADRQVYSQNSSIKWAFGEGWPASFCVDARYRFFGTFDVLRKVPLLRYCRGVTLNQGFHDLSHPVAGRADSTEWMGDCILPIRHFKLAKLFDASLKDQVERQGNTPDLYHPRTASNIRKFMQTEVGELIGMVGQANVVRYNPDRFGKIHRWAAAQVGLKGGTRGSRFGTFLREIREKALRLVPQRTSR